ncbi:MAG: C4-dicarboxylate transporter DcuC [Alphaproteobacteria bacterium]|jgi:DcuC family C4-dicarboxylate transporter|nr:C4-dicarboxylate transporter DcuC [Alphaproteobacteria bacterium]
MIISALIVIATIILIGRLILKGYSAKIVLLIGGFILMTSAALLKQVEILPSNVKPTGLMVGDLLAFLDYMFSVQTAGLGLIIMLLSGFSMYMSEIKANDSVVLVFTKPLKKLNSPSLLLFLAYLVSVSLTLAVPSASGLGLLLMVTIFPTLVALSISPLSAAAVIATSSAVTFSPLAVDSIAAANFLGEDLLVFTLYKVLPMALATILVVGISHVFWQKYMDKKIGFKASEQTINDKNLGAPKFYAILPFLPIIFIILFPIVMPKLGFNFNVNVNIVVLLSVAIIFITELAVKRNFKAVCNTFESFFKGMGDSFTSVVVLLVAAGFFANGLMAIGVIDDMINFSKSAGFPAHSMTVLLAVITLGGAFMTGSGNAIYLAFAPMIPSLANSLGISGTTMMLPTLQASNMGRAMSPVSGVVIAVSGIAKVSPFDIMKRTSIPILIGFLFNLIMTIIFVS